MAAACTLVALVTFWATHLVRRRVPAIARPQGPLNLLLITADTLGADMLGCYGNREIATPALDALAASGALFENATTAAPLTLPAHTSILTGTYPMAHGVRDNVGFYVRPGQVTLAGLLKNAGWTTGAFVGAFVLDARWGLNQGFDRYVDDFDLSTADVVSPDSARHSGEEVLAHAVQWLDTARTKPFFAWVHFYDSHGPYNPPEPFRSRYRDAPWGAYKAEVAHVDALVGRLLEWLDRQHLAERTIVAFIGDHGESLGRHGETSHGVLVYDATLHVPLLVRVPGASLQGRIRPQVRSIDLAPTLLELLGIAAPSAMEGQSLLDLSADRVAYSESFNPRYAYGWSELRSLHTAKYHFVDAPKPELYDISRDPGEVRNLAGTEPDVRRRLERQLDDMVRGDTGAHNPAPSRSVDDEARRRLASLGYVDGGGQATHGRPAANPIEKIALANVTKEAEADLAGGRLDAAGAAAKRVLASDPDMPAPYNILGNVQLQKGDAPAALTTYRTLLARDPEYRPALYNIAVAYYRMHQPKAAAEAWRRLLALDPRDVDVLVRLAQVAAERGDRMQATALFEQALAANPSSAEAEAGLGSVAMSSGNLQVAERRYRRAAELNPALQDVHYDLGVVLHGLRDLRGAEQEYRREIQLHPENVKAYHYLGLLYAETNNFEGQRAAFEQVVQRQPQIAQAQFMLADALLQTNQTTAALEHVKRAIELDPTQESPYLLLAAIEDKLGNSAEKARALALARSRRRP